MAKTKITNDEKELLKQYSKTSPLTLVRLKSQTILLASKYMSDEDIADILDRKQRTIAQWRRSWHRIRFASIFTGHKDNANAAKLTKEQKLTLAEALSNPPNEYGLPKEFWDVPQLKSYVKATFDVVYKSDRTYRFLLTFSNLSFKYPDTFDLKHNEPLILERMKSIRSEVTPLLVDDVWEVFACDEVKMQQDAIIRRAWLKKGQRTVVKVDRNKQSQSYIGFLNQKNFKCHLYEMSWQNSKEVLRAVKQFLKAYPDKKICLVWDNAPFHKSNALREQLKTGGIMERVHLIAMPPYAPDENPIEHVWNTTKQAVANIQRDSFEATKKAFSDFVAKRTFQYMF